MRGSGLAALVWGALGGVAFAQAADPDGGRRGVAQDGARPPGELSGDVADGGSTQGDGGVHSNALDLTPVPTIDATPTHWPRVSFKPGRPLPVLPTRHSPHGQPNVVDGKVWTQSLYTVSQPVGVEWGYGQVGVQLDAENIFGTHMGLHVDGFAQQRAYHRPLRVGVRQGFLYFGKEPYAGSGVQHARYLTFDRLTEANVQFRNAYTDVRVGRIIVPTGYQALVDGVSAVVVALPQLRVGGFTGLMPDPWHPRMWLDSDYRSLANFFPSERGEAFSGQPLQDDVGAFLRRPTRPLDNLLNGQTIFNFRYATAGAWVSTRFGMVTSDTSAQLILFNPAAGFAAADDGLTPSPQELGVGQPPFGLIDGFYVNNVLTFRPVPMLNFHLRSSWDAWGALRSLDARRVAADGSPIAVVQHPVQYLDPFVDSTAGLRELVADMTFRGDWPVGASAQVHHYQSQLTYSSYAFYQRDLLQPRASQAFADAGNNPGAKPGPYMPMLVEPKIINNQHFGVVQRERARVNGWVRPWGFLLRGASMQLYAEAYLEWRRDFPKARPDSDVVCIQDLNQDSIPERYYSRNDCGSRNLPRKDDQVRVAGTAGIRDPTLYDNLTYDFSITATDSWHNRSLDVRGRVGAQAFDHVFVDLGFMYQLSHNQRYYTSDVKYDVTGARRNSAPVYPDNVTGQAFVLDASVMYRVALGLTFDANYLLFFEEEPVVQDYILGNGEAPAGIRGFIPRDPYQAEQLFLLRAVYRL